MPGPYMGTLKGVDCLPNSQEEFKGGSVGQAKRRNRGRQEKEEALPYSFLDVGQKVFDLVKT